ncbi:MAG: hypothetical protein C4K58_08150 [Flavobacteriaceae bacterium]|nr:MAG: hypothetical protein C4K58_08150 [Flavobacteriaceae bacterium]
MGYSDFMAQDYVNAKKNLKEALVLGSKEVECNYLLGHIAYVENDFDAAIKHFDVLTKDPVYSVRALPYLAQISYKNKRFDLAQKYGSQFLAKPSENEKLVAEVSKIVGESYFAEKKYAEAKPYFEKYLETVNNTPQDRYQYAYSLFKSGDIENALVQYKKVIESGDPALTQKSYYQLANNWLQNKDKEKAKKEYLNSTLFPIDKQLEEDALYKVSKIDFEKATSVEQKVLALKGFIDKYPFSVHKPEFEKYLTNQYLSIGDYEKAKDILQNSDYKDPAALNIAKQKLAYKNGINLYKEGNYQASLDALEEALSYEADPTIKPDAIYWKSQALAKLGRTDEQVAVLNKLETETPEGQYNSSVQYQKAFAFYQKADYPNAILYYEKYLEQEPNTPQKGGILLNLANSYTNVGSYEKALDIYDKLISEKLITELDQVSYQKAKIYEGQVRDEELKKEYERFVIQFPNSPLLDEVQYQLADIYFRNNQNDKAMPLFESVIAKSPNKDFVAKAKLKKGLLLAEAEKNAEAIAVFEDVIASEPGSDNALKAVGAAKDIFISAGDVAGFKKWTQKLGLTFDDSDFEVLAFDAAEKLYLDKNYKEAITGIEDYLKDYPDTKNLVKARYMLAESAYNLKMTDKAATYYTNLTQGPNEYYKKSLDRLSNIYAESKDYTNLGDVYEKLYVVEDPSKKPEIENKLLTIYQRTQNWGKVVQYARLVEKGDAKNDPAKLEQVRLIQVRSLEKLGTIAQSREVYQRLETTQDESIRAEAFHFKAYFLSKDGKIDKSNEQILANIDKFPDQDYWGAKGMILYAENLIKKGEKEEAKVTLETVIENFGGDYEDINEEAKTLLGQLN